MARREAAWDEAVRCSSESIALARAAGDEFALARALVALGQVETARGAYDRAAA